METTAGLCSTSEYETVTDLGLAQHLGCHHGDEEALCHQDQDGKMAADRLRATKQAGVSGSYNAGHSTRTTGRPVSESGEVLISITPSTDSQDVLPGKQLAAVNHIKLQQGKEAWPGVLRWSCGGNQPTIVLQMGNTTTMSLDTVQSIFSSYLFKVKDSALQPVLHTVLRKSCSFWRHSPPEIGHLTEV